MLESSSLEKEGRFVASKWLKVPVLLEREEMASLLEELGGGAFYLTSGVTDGGLLSVGEFLEMYGHYVEGLKGGEPTKPEATRGAFSSVWSIESDALYRQEVGEGRSLIRVRRPVIQLRPHSLHYSPLDGKIRSMMPGVSWGIEFSYPTLMQVGSDIVRVGEESANSAPFKRLQRWMRNATLPTPFVAHGERMNMPIRLGRRCFEWIGAHPELGDLEVAV